METEKESLPPLFKNWSQMYYFLLFYLICLIFGFYSFMNYFQ